MRIFTLLLDGFVFVLNLPLYAITVPVMRWVNGYVASKIAEGNCPSCDRSLSTILAHDIHYIGQQTGASAVPINWERVPTRFIVCPSCSEPVCFDRKLRTTACDGSDAILDETKAKGW